MFAEDGSCGRQELGGAVEGGVEGVEEVPGRQQSGIERQWRGHAAGAGGVR